jgi:heptosyltransferase III
MFPKNPASILIIKTGAIGDTILFLPALEAVRQKFPKAFVEIMGHEERLSLLKENGYADSIVSIESKNLHSLFIKNARPSESLLKYLRRFDLIFTFVKDETVFVDNIRKFSKGQIVQIPPFPEERGEHVVDYLLNALKGYGIEPKNRIPKLFAGADAKKSAVDFLQKHSIEPGSPVMAIHPGSGGKTKNWPLERFFEIGVWLKQKCGARILLIIGPAEEAVEKTILDTMNVLNPVVAKNLSLEVLSGLLVFCQCFIGNDSGITHMAAALGIPTVALFGPSDPHVWGPRGENAVILKSSDSCGRGKGFMDGITMERVKREIDQLV